MLNLSFFVILSNPRGKSSVAETLHDYRPWKRTISLRSLYPLRSLYILSRLYPVPSKDRWAVWFYAYLGYLLSIQRANAALFTDKRLRELVHANYSLRYRYVTPFRSSPSRLVACWRHVNVDSGRCTDKVRFVRGGVLCAMAAFTVYVLKAGWRAQAQESTGPTAAGFVPGDDKGGRRRLVAR